MITFLQPHEIFVAGTNAQGSHGAGAAKQAFEQFGLEWGIANGLSGQTYAIDTMSGFDALGRNVRQFLRVAKDTPQYTYLVTAIGCGIAGYMPEQVAPLFKNCPSNVVLPEEFL